MSIAGQIMVGHTAPTVGSTLVLHQWPRLRPLQRTSHVGVRGVQVHLDESGLPAGACAPLLRAGLDPPSAQTEDKVDELEARPFTRTKALTVALPLPQPSAH